MKISNEERLVSGGDVKARILELETVLRVLDMSDCDEQRDALLPEFSVLKKLDCAVSYALARAWTTEVLVRGTYFGEYMRQRAESEFRDGGWLLAHVDWQQVALAARMDWMSVEFDGVTYWVR
ncbi:hypothetical protein [Burkholderia sp. Ac-20365]|uniref:hypothetical protein n=1 Tax=Burkholderia sp. Ac-20365 TaxID=2703897 RepID=UPI00197C53BD|nr:hypothetical protein [Burkholderia sp. Ac-20365]MBN3762369.1 hypothetical protein [Burkholderia sp. Ac-20365]